ncbi:MAG: hypothetical protein HXX09_16040, partial [Bacteroidetes bacterium]|nr:hypothetical protein [Bacteroidota bacterium]
MTPKSFITILLVFILKISVAVNYTWTGTTNTTWNLATNWSPAGIPGAADNATIVSTANQPVLSANTSIKNFTLTSGTLNLNGFALNISGISVFNGGQIDNGNLNITGSSSTFAGTIFNSTITAVCANIYFNGATFNQNGMIEKTGAGDDASIGGNFFASSSWLQIKNSGTGNLIFGTVNPDVFSGSTEIYNNSPAAEIRIADGSFGNIISGNVTFDNGTSAAPSSRSIHICNTGSLSVSGAIRLNNFGSAGIFFGENGGNTTFTNSSNIGSFGFVDGTLQWSNVTSDQVNNIWYMAGTASLKLGPGTVFNQSFSATSP